MGKGSTVLVISLGLLQCFIGLSGIAGGVGLVSAPDGTRLGFALEWLNNAPFADYLIPGLFLLVIVGIGTIVAGLATFLRYRNTGELAVLFGAIMMLWIALQVWWIDLTSRLQPLFFTLGFFELTLGFLIRNQIKQTRKA